MLAAKHHKSDEEDIDSKLNDDLARDMRVAEDMMRRELGIIETSYFVN